MSRRWIATFLEAQAAELDAARNTQLAYAHDLKDFDDWLGAHSATLESAVRGDVEAYLVHCDAQGLARATRARRLSAIKQLYRFAFEEGWRTDNPAIQIKGPGREKSLPKTLSVPEVDQLLQAARALGRSPEDRARRLARVLVSDILCYNRDRRDEALRNGTLMEVLGEEIRKSWELYKEKVGPEIAGSTDYFKEALNEILADGQDVF